MKAKRIVRPIRDFVRNIPLRLRGEVPITYCSISEKKLVDLVDKPNPVILDIGSNDGTHTKWFTEIFENPQIYSFEPDPRALARFGRVVGNRSNIEVFPIVISDTDGFRTFFQSGGKAEGWRPGGWDYSGSIRRPKKHLELHPWCTFETSIEVPSMRLDTWANERSVNNVDLIWMDVQGAEMDVVAGGIKTLEKTRFVFAEYSNVELYEGQAGLNELLDVMSGFDVVARYPGDVLLRNRHL